MINFNKQRLYTGQTLDSKYIANIIIRFNLETYKPMIDDFQFEIFGDLNIDICKKGYNFWIRFKGKDIKEVYLPNVRDKGVDNTPDIFLDNINQIPTYDPHFICFEYRGHKFGNTLYSLNYENHTIEQYFCDATDPYKQWGWVDKKWYNKFTTSEYLRYNHEGKLTSFYLSKIYPDRVTEFDFINKFKPWQVSLYFTPGSNELRALTICPDYNSA
jgi:hypothetical protein